MELSNFADLKMLVKYKVDFWIKKLELKISSFAGTNGCHLKFWQLMRKSTNKFWIPRPQTFGLLAAFSFKFWLDTNLFQKTQELLFFCAFSKPSAHHARTYYISLLYWRMKPSWNWCPHCLSGIPKDYWSLSLRPAPKTSFYVLTYSSSCYRLNRQIAQRSSRCLLTLFFQHWIRK